MELNDKEKKTLRAFPADEPIGIAELAKIAFPGMGNRGNTRGNSWVRNSLRGLLKAKMIQQIGRGLYVLTTTPTASKKPTTPKKAKNSAPKIAGGNAQAHAVM